MPARPLRPRPRSVWFLPFLVAAIVFGSHYSRDVTGALQTELEREIPLTHMEFSIISSLYYFPNLAVPLLVGILQDMYDCVAIFVATVILSAGANLMFAAGVSARSVPLLIAGRGATGVFYEAVDMGSIPVTGPLFKDRFALVSGITNGCLRLGSVANFLMSPWLYERYGLSTAIWVSSLIAATGFVFALLIKLVLDKNNLRPPYSELDLSGGEDGNKYDDDKDFSGNEDNITANNSAAEEGDDQVGTDEKAVNGRRDIDLNKESAGFRRENKASNGFIPVQQGGDRTLDADEGEGDIGEFSGDDDEANDVKTQSNAVMSGSEAVGSSGETTSVWQKLRGYAREVPGLPRIYWMYVAVGCLGYMCLVPFYSVGSAMLQRRYSLTTAEAGVLMLLPEGTIALVAPCLGLVVDRWGRTTRVRRMGWSLCVFSPAFFIMAVVDHGAAPYASMVALGLSWAVFNAVFWGLVGDFCGLVPHLMGISVGILGCAMNVGSALLLLIIGGLQSSLGLDVADRVVFVIFSALSIASAVTAFMLERVVRRDEGIFERNTNDGDETAAEENTGVHEDDTKESPQVQGAQVVEMTSLLDPTKANASAGNDDTVLVTSELQVSGGGLAPSEGAGEYYTV